jgi:hypothetical protein
MINIYMCVYVCVLLKDISLEVKHVFIISLKFSFFDL